MSADTKSPRYLVSACLAGIHSRYNGDRKALDAVVELIVRGEALPVCPEQLGGLPTPRPPCEIQGGRVVNKEGVDQTEEFTLGAEETLRLAKLFGAARAVLKAGSPSCGSGEIYDGSFSGKRIPGDGICAAILKKAGVEVITEDDFLQELEENAQA